MIKDNIQNPTILMKASPQTSNIIRTETKVIIGFSPKDEYPQKGTLIAVDESIIVDRVNEINNTREDADKKYSKILSKFVQSGTQIPISTLFVESEIQLKYGAPNKIAVRVNEILESNKVGEFYLRCELPMFRWPDDVDIHDRVIDIRDIDAQAIDIHLCDMHNFITENRPDQINVFGFLDKTLSYANDTKLYRCFNKSPEKTTPEIIEFILSNGMKCFSSLIKYSYEEHIPSKLSKETFDMNTNIKKLPVNESSANFYDLIKNETKKCLQELNTHKNSLNTTYSEYNDEIHKHPLYEYTKRLFLGFKMLMNEHVVQMTNAKIDVDELSDDVFFEFFDAMLRTKAESLPAMHEFDKTIVDNDDSEIDENNIL